MTRSRRRGLSRTPSPFVQPSPRPAAWRPGRCQVCSAFGPAGEYWPSFLPGRFIGICEDCLKLGDDEIARRVLEEPPPRRDGAVA